jgi:hypothetical protein
MKITIVVISSVLQSRLATSNAVDRLLVLICHPLFFQGTYLIFLVELRGKSMTKWTCVGTLKPAIRSRQNSTISSGIVVRHFCRYTDIDDFISAKFSQLSLKLIVKHQLLHFVYPVNFIAFSHEFYPLCAWEPSAGKDYFDVALTHPESSHGKVAAYHLPTGRITAVASSSFQIQYYSI